VPMPPAIEALARAVGDGSGAIGHQRCETVLGHAGRGRMPPVLEVCKSALLEPVLAGGGR
jgi:hypothetical protein